MPQTDEEKREKRNAYRRNARAKNRPAVEEDLPVHEGRDVEEELQEWLANNVARYYQALLVAKAPNGLIEKMVIDYHSAMLAVLNQRRGN